MSWTYSNLKTAVQDYLESTETSFVSHLDEFIETTEERILKNVQLDEFLTLDFFSAFLKHYGRNCLL